MDEPTFFQIRIRGHLDDTWMDLFESLTLSNLDDGDSLLSGTLPDQAALQGVLNRISRLGLTLISVNTVPEEDRMEGNISMNTKSNYFVRYSLPLFLILTPLISLAIPLVLTLPAEVTPLLLVIVPALLAILLTALAEGGKGVSALLKKLFLRVSVKWIVIALGLALALRLSVSLCAIFFGWIPILQLYPWSPQQFLMIGVFTLFGAIMEELGWRGYALPRLLIHRSPLVSALIIGIPWGILHLGLILPGQMNAGMPWMATLLFIVALSVVLTWLFINTRGSLFIVVLHHAIQNFLVFLNGGVPPAQSSWLLAAVTVVLALGIIIFFGINLQRDPLEKQELVGARQARIK